MESSECANGNRSRFGHGHKLGYVGDDPTVANPASVRSARLALKLGKGMGYNNLRRF